MVEKMRDAISMLWLNLDAQERQLFLYGVYCFAMLLAWLYLRPKRLERERRERELLAEAIAEQLVSRGD